VEYFRNKRHSGKSNALQENVIKGNYSLIHRGQWRPIIISTVVLANFKLPCRFYVRDLIVDINCA
jgi:hypothetical protein